MDIKSLIILKCFFLLIFYFNPFVEGDIPYGLCANPACSVPVGKGITILRYSSPDDSKISVEVNEAVEIFVKDYGPKKDLWGVVVRGNRGYISKKFIREESAYERNLVPAVAEFKTPILVADSYLVNSHLHVSSHHQKSDGLLSDIPESFMHTTTIHQQDIISPIPSGVQQQMISQSENLQASHLNPSLQWNPSDKVDLHSNFEDSSQIFKTPDDSSHFHYDSNNILSHTTDMYSENILPSQPHETKVYSSMHQQNDILYSSFPQSGMNSVPDIQQNSLEYSLSDSLRPSSVHPSQHFESYSQYPPNMQQSNFEQSNMQQQYSQQSNMQQQYSQQSSMQQQYSEQSNMQQQYSEQPNVHQKHFHSPSVPEMHSSFYDSDIGSDQINDELSKTYAMLRSHGIDDPDMFINSLPESHIQQSSQNTKVDYGSKEVEINAVPSHSPAQSSETFHSSVNADPSLNQEKIMQNSKILIENEHDFNKPSNEHFHSKVDHSTITNKINEVATDDEDEDEQDELESEVLAEDDYSDEGEEEEEEEEDLDIIDGKKLAKVSVSGEYLETAEPYIESSMSSLAQSQQILKTDQHTQSPSDSESLTTNLRDTSSHSHTTSVHQEESTFSSTDIEFNVLKESRMNEDSPVLHSTIQPSVLTNSVDKIIESSDLNSTNDDFHKSTAKISDVLKEATTVPENPQNSASSKGKKFEKDNFLDRDVFTDIPDRNNNDALQVETGTFNKENTAPQINQFFAENEQNSELNKFINTMDVDGIEDNLKSTYQIRNLKGEYTNTEEQQSDSDSGNDENNTQSDSDMYKSFENGLDALRSFIDAIMSWIPEPLYSAIMDLQTKSISPRVPVFTVLCGFTCIFFIVPVLYIKEKSKESKLSAQLASIEKDAYSLSATNAVLEEKFEATCSELNSVQKSLEDEKNISIKLKVEFEEQADELANIKAELDGCLEELDCLKERENEYLDLLNDNKKDKDEFLEEKCAFEKIIKDQEDSIAKLNDQLQESENNLKELEKEKLQYIQLKEDYEEKLAQFERNCNTLLQEAEVWNLRVNELTANVSEERALKEELETSLREKDEEIESLKQLVETCKMFDEIEDPEEQVKTKEEKLQTLMQSSMILNQLKKQEEETKLLDEQLGKEKAKLLDMEVELLEAKSETDKLKINYNQALQDKAEAQTKLDVLTNYFKDKEIQLQKQLGAQEAVRQKKEEDVSSAERRICLIEQENSSYKYQVASMKQEMEETERNLKSQIAVQEKKAHENWIAARAAERKLEEVKQEVTQLRQRLTLLEREQENWVNSSRDEILRPVPKRIPGANEESGNQDINTSERGMFPPPIHDRLPPVPPPMMLPPDRPLPPLPPPPLPHMFLPPMERHFRPQPWHLPPDPSSDFRTTPPEFMTGRESTPPRSRPFAIADGDTGPHASSPLTTDTRDSRNSTPPHLLPDFHDVPPQPGARPFYPHLGHPRLPMHPPYRRDIGPPPKRIDNPNEYGSRGAQQASSQEQWQHSRV